MIKFYSVYFCFTQQNKNKIMTLTLIKFIFSFLAFLKLFFSISILLLSNTVKAFINSPSISFVWFLFIFFFSCFFFAYNFLNHEKLENISFNLGRTETKALLAFFWCEFCGQKQRSKCTWVNLKQERNFWIWKKDFAENFLSIFLIKQHQQVGNSVNGGEDDHVYSQSRRFRDDGGEKR